MMRTATDVHFGSFRVDVGNECVWREDQALRLTPKAFAVLQYLLEHAGQLVTKDALWQAVWQGVSVTDAALTMCVTEVRKAFGDNAKTPQFLETVHRRGYRWIAPVSAGAAPVSSFKPVLSLVEGFQVRTLRTQDLALSTRLSWVASQN